jgi:hypothetical protein
VAGHSGIDMTTNVASPISLGAFVSAEDAIRTIHANAQIATRATRRHHIAVGSLSSPIHPTWLTAG